MAFIAVTRRFLKQARERADQLGVPSVAVVFGINHGNISLVARQDCCQPRRHHQIQRKDPGVSPFVDGVQVLKFNAQLSSQSPEQFVQHWLLDQLGIQHLVVGDDFRFGAKPLTAIMPC